MQGDVIAIIDRYGDITVEYTYDAWGNLLTTTGLFATTIGVTNPLRYRGYVYDTETGLYYLQSRYYDPEIGRFINADAFATTGQGLLGNNMFAYCTNNPVVFYDPTGKLNMYCLMVSDSGMNVQARAYLANKKLEDRSDHERNFLKPAVLYSVPVEDGDLCYTAEISASHGVIEADNVTLTADMVVVGGGVDIGRNGIALAGGAYLFRESFSFEILDGVSIELGTSIGVGGTAKFTSDGFKLGGSIGPGMFVSIVWDQASGYKYL